MNAKPKRCAAADCANKASPTSPGGFCSYHATKEGSQFPGSKSKATAKPTKSPRGDAAATKKKAGGGDIFDRLTDHNNYTGVYKERFDDDGKGKGVNLTTSHTNQNDLSDLADRTASDVRGLKITDSEEKKTSSAKPKSKKCADSACSNKASPTSPGGFCSYHATKEGSQFPGSKSKSTAKPTKSPRGDAATSSTATKKKAGGGGIFDRLTDHNNYTGVYKERFDADGKGKGVNLTTSHQGGTQLNDLLDRTPADVRGRKV